MLLGLSLLIFFPMFGQRKIVVVFRYHSLKFNKSCVFSVSVTLQTRKHETVHSSLDCDAESTWFYVKGELCWPVRRGGWTAQSDANQALGIFSSASSRICLWGSKNERASAEIILKSFDLPGKLLPLWRAGWTSLFLNLHGINWRQQGWKEGSWIRLCTWNAAMQWFSQFHFGEFGQLHQLQHFNCYHPVCSVVRWTLFCPQ